MDSELYQWLVQIEESLVRMILGVYRFVIEGLPTMVYRFIIDTVGPLAGRLCRVTGLAIAWLVMLFSPFMLGHLCGLNGWWTLFSLVWLAVAILGSWWGLNHIVIKRKASL
jgi:hypothetical protein